MSNLTRYEKIGFGLLAAFCVFFLIFFGYLIFVMPDYGTSVFTH